MQSQSPLPPLHVSVAAQPLQATQVENVQPLSDAAYTAVEKVTAIQVAQVAMRETALGETSLGYVADIAARGAVYSRCFCC